CDISVLDPFKRSPVCSMSSQRVSSFSEKRTRHHERKDQRRGADILLLCAQRGSLGPSSLLCRIFRCDCGVLHSPRDEGVQLSQLLPLLYMACDIPNLRRFIFHTCVCLLGAFVV
ncbi:hypothetical protein PENTCL1PPCAC_29318, partial [Pristionchus entomophagus]